MSLHQHEDPEHETGPSAHDSGTSTRKLALVALVNFVGFVVELAGGLLFGSVALISDALHMLFDMLAYVMAFGASYTAERFEAGESWSYGLHRLEPVAAFLNGVLLIPMVGYIVWESYQRFLNPVEINPELTLVIATGGLLVNLGSVWVLQGGEMSLNERGAFYHLLGDAGGSVAVIVATAAVAVGGPAVADPVAAVLIGVLVLASAGNVLRESTSILFQRSPIEIGRLRTEIADIEGVDRITDVHIWQVCSQLTVGTVTVVDSASTIATRRAVREAVHECLSAHGVDHATVEVVEQTTDEASGRRTEHTH
jgi:cobalt-zinc-cadmium efflux system protein